ncbi:hypothetical protein M758_UG132300 [Ceratodon purpureus]|nr:hypothetical protein M758_UG132300 [Ceratodon purpureus]
MIVVNVGENSAFLSPTSQPWAFEVEMAGIKGNHGHIPSTWGDRAKIIDNRLQSLKCTRRQRHRVLSCLDVHYLRRLPLVGKSHAWPKDPANRNYRYHFRAQIAHILGWRERHKFPEHIDELICEQLWPDNAVTVERQGGHQIGSGSEARIAQPRHSASCEKEDRCTEEEDRGECTLPSANNFAAAAIGTAIGATGIAIADNSIAAGARA